MNVFALASASRGESVMLPPTSRVTISIITYSVITAAFECTRNSIHTGLCIPVPDFQTDNDFRTSLCHQGFGSSRYVASVFQEVTVVAVSVNTFRDW